jgi:hypothetical protein
MCAGTGSTKDILFNYAEPYLHWTSATIAPITWTHQWLSLIRGSKEGYLHLASYYHLGPATRRQE